MTSIPNENPLPRPSVPLIERFAPLAVDYDVLFCDVWGVVHNGVAAFADACDALARFRSSGGTAILLTNAPRPAAAVARILDRFGVPRADYVVCSGLFDDTTETPESYRDMLALIRARRLFMVCANPDVVVERGDTLIYCAGAIADAYGALGGEVLYCGKPYMPIYETALEKVASLRGGTRPPLSRVLAIGDSVRTDLSGAAAFGLDCIFVTSRLHAEAYGSREAPDVAALNAMFAAAGVTPKAIMRGLTW
jgi:ribonucleotide monophosphatase NagD (HAD superfamily)